MRADARVHLWVHARAQWSDESVAADVLDFVDGLWKVLALALQSWSAFYGIPELQLGSQMTTPPNLGYVTITCWRIRLGRF
jgi:hypothetical protein